MTFDRDHSPGRPVLAVSAPLTTESVRQAVRRSRLSHTDSRRLTRRESLKRFGGTVLGAVSVGVSGCLDAQVLDGGSGDGTPAEGVPSAASVEATTAVSGLEVPWDLTFAGDDAFLTERDGGVRTVSTDALLTSAELTVDDTEVLLAKSALPDQETLDFGGVLGVAAHPAYPDDPRIYVYYSADDGDPQNRVAWYDREADTVTTIVDSIPGRSVHHGGRITFGPAGNLWISTGDAGDPELTQDPRSLAGALLRVTPSGDPAPDNPDFDGEADPRTFSHGYRNPQGIAFHPDGTAFTCDHGPESRDEVAVVRPGGNYGWDLARGGPEDPDYGSYSDHETFEPPVLNTGPETTWAPSGATFYAGDAIDAWQDRLFVCGLVSETLYAITLTRPGSGDDPPLGSDGTRYDEPWLDAAYTATAHPLFEREYGRLRQAVQGPNGSVFLLTSNRDGQAGGEFPRDGDDRIVRLDPA